MRVEEFEIHRSRNLKYTDQGIKNRMHEEILAQQNFQIPFQYVVPSRHTLYSTNNNTVRTYS